MRRFFKMRYARALTRKTISDTPKAIPILKPVLEVTLPLVAAITTAVGDPVEDWAVVTVESRLVFEVRVDEVTSVV